VSDGRDRFLVLDAHALNLRQRSDAACCLEQQRTHGPRHRLRGEAKTESAAERHVLEDRHDDVAVGMSFVLQHDDASAAQGCLFPVAEEATARRTIRVESGVPPGVHDHAGIAGGDDAPRAHLHRLSKAGHLFAGGGMQPMEGAEQRGELFGGRWLCSRRPR
jgi:hypothetical protein